MDDRMTFWDWVVLVLCVAAFLVADELTACLIAPVFCIVVMRELEWDCNHKYEKRNSWH